MKVTISALVATVALGLAPQLAAQVSIGETPEFNFRLEVKNGLGIRSLADLRGKPVLVDFWGTK